jgi:hypothetical protein
VKERAGNDDEVTAPLQIASYHGTYPYPEDFDGSTSISEQVLETSEPWPRAPIAGVEPAKLARD